MKNKTVPLDLSVRFISGVGPKKGEAFEKAGVFTLRDLLFYLPRRYLDRTRTTPVASLNGPTEVEVTIVGTITDAREVRTGRGRTFYEAWLEDDSGEGIKLVWFRRTNQIRKWIKPGLSAAFSGKVNSYGMSLQIAHPEVTYLSRGEVEDLKAGRGRWVALYPGGKDFEKAGLDARSHYQRFGLDILSAEMNYCIQHRRHNAGDN